MQAAASGALSIPPLPRPASAGAALPQPQLAQHDVKLKLRFNSSLRASSSGSRASGLQPPADASTMTWQSGEWLPIYELNLSPA